MIKTQFGAPESCDIAAALNLSFGLCLFIFNGGPNVLREDKEFKKKLKALKNRAHTEYAKDDQSVSSHSASSYSRKQKVMGPSGYAPQPKSDKDGFLAFPLDQEKVKKGDKYTNIQ
jgi:hypothetical protein